MSFMEIHETSLLNMSLHSLYLAKNRLIPISTSQNSYLPKE